MIRFVRGHAVAVAIVGVSVAVLVVLFATGNIGLAVAEIIVGFFAILMASGVPPRRIGQRLAQLGIVLIVVSFFTFLLIRLLPGDPVQTIIPFGTGPAFAKARAQLRADLGLNKGFFAQYWDYLKGLVQLHFGHQYSSGTEVSTLVKQSLPVSLELMIYAMIISLIIAIPLGVLGAYRAGTRTDSAINTTAFGLLALPNFVLALLLSFFIGAKLKFLPTGGYAPGWLDRAFTGDWGPVLWLVGALAVFGTLGWAVGRLGSAPGLGVMGGLTVGVIAYMVFGFVVGGNLDLYQHLRFMLLPAITLAAGQIAVFQRLLRSDMIATLQENFITLAKAEGPLRAADLVASRPATVQPHPVDGRRPERGRPHRRRRRRGGHLHGAGDGREDFPGHQRGEYVELQSYIVIIAVGFVLVNFFVDFLYAVLDPRIRRARAVA